MSAKQQMQNPEPALEHPDLAALYAAETAAVARIDQIKERIPLAEADVRLRERDKAALSSRAARGEAVTAADIRRAGEGIEDAQAMVALLKDALPKAFEEAKAASSARSSVEGVVARAHRQPFEDAYQRAEERLRDATAARDMALAHTKQMPHEAKARLDCLLQRHGQDIKAARRVADIHTTQEANRIRAQTGQPLVDVV